MTHLWHSKLRSRIIMLQKFEMDILGIDPAILLRHIYWRWLYCTHRCGRKVEIRVRNSVALSLL